MKRVLDFIYALLALAFLAPLFAIVALAIKLGDGGPVFFSQIRVGRFGRAFRLYKFRTMIPNAERLGLAITVGDDRRITRVGRWLRRTKLDELPQFWNVVKGDMSLVGPRPEVPRYVAYYTRDQRRVLLVRPGITDPASLAYFDEASILKGCQCPEATYIGAVLPRKLTLNLDYLRRRTLASDVLVVMATIWRLASSLRPPSLAVPALLGSHRGLIEKFSCVALSGFMRQFAFFAVNAYFAYCLSKETFGTLTCAFGSLLVFIGIADFGLREIAWRDVARNPLRTPDVVNTVLAARVAMTLVAMLGYVATATVYCHGAADWVIFLVYSLGLFFNMTSFDYPFLGRDKMGTISKCSAIAYAYYVPACLLSVRGDSTAWLSALHFVLAHMIFFGLLYREYRRTFGPTKLAFHWDITADYFRRSWPLGVNGLVFRLTINYPVLLLGLVLSTVAVAEYRLAEMFYSLFASLGLYLGSSMYTTYAMYEGESDCRIAHSVEAALRMILLVHLPVAFAFATLLPWLLERFMKIGSAGEAMICLLLGVSLPLGVATRYLKTCLPSVGLNRQLLTVNVASMVIGIGLGVGLVGEWGAPGIAASVLVAETVGLGLILLFVKQKLPTLRVAPIFEGPTVMAAALVALYVVSMAIPVPVLMRSLMVLVASLPVLSWIILSQLKPQSQPQADNSVVQIEQLERMSA